MGVRSVLLLVAISATWGASYLFIDLSMAGGMSPAVVACGRLVVGAALLLGLALLTDRRALLALRRMWWRVALFGLFQMAVPYLLIAAGESRIPTGLASTLVSTQPMWLVLLMLVAPKDRPRAGRLVGVAVGMVGVIALVDPFSSGRPDPLGAVLVAGAGLSYALAAVVLAKLLPGVKALPLTAAAEGFAALVTLPLAAVTLPAAVPPAGSIAALVVLGAVCTAGGFALYVRLAHDVGTGPASLIAYLAPVFSIAYGALLLGEPLRPMMVVGLAFVLAGSALTSGLLRRRRMSGAQLHRGGEHVDHGAVAQHGDGQRPADGLCEQLPLQALRVGDRSAGDAEHQVARV